MAKFKVGDKIVLDYDCRFNKDYRDLSTQHLLEYLDSHQNIFTVMKVKESRVYDGLVYLEEVKEYFFTSRFKLSEGSSFNATEQDLENLLNG